MIAYQTVNVPPGLIGLILEYSMAGKGDLLGNFTHYNFKESQSTVNLSFVSERNSFCLVCLAAFSEYSL